MTPGSAFGLGEEPSVLVLQVFGTIDDLTMPGSQVVEANCGHLCWISPDGLSMPGTVYTMCVRCMRDSYMTEEDIDQIQSVPGAAAAFPGVDLEPVLEEWRRHHRRQNRRKGRR